MNRFVSLDKQSKKARKKYYSGHRCTWGELNPVTRSVPSGKTYNRKKDKKRIGREFRDEFDAGLFFVYGIVKENLCSVFTETTDLPPM